jgi:phosphoenolpyruvate carboxykinase (ATP)
VIFLTADAFGILPPVSKLTEDQTKYHFISGYTAKVAGTERGITEPVPSFSACFGAAFLLLDPIIYANELTRKMKEHGASAWLVNTGWVGGGCGKGGERIDIVATRKIIDAILEGSLQEVEYETLPVFNLSIPKSVPGVEPGILNPRNIWSDPSEWDKTALELGRKFKANFEAFADSEETAALIAAGPQI